MIETVRLVNFISHGDTTLDLDEGVNIFIGKNGAGKSSVIDAITYALYGEHTREQAKNLVKRGASSGGVSVRFTLGNKEYLAERRFGKAGSLESGVLRELSGGARVIVQGERKQFGESMTSKASEIIGLDYDKMRVSTVVQQGELDQIIRYSPKDFKELINGVIGIDRLDIAFSNSSDAITGFRQHLRNDCGFDDTEIEQVENMKADRQTRKDEADTKLHSLAQELAGLKSREELVKNDLTSYELMKSKLGQLEARRRDLTTYVEEQRKQLKAELLSLKEDLDMANRYLEQASRKEDIEAKENEYNSKESTLSETQKHIRGELSELKPLQVQLEEYGKDITDTKKKIEVSGRKISDLEPQIANLASIQKPCEELQEVLEEQTKRLNKSILDSTDRKGSIKVQFENYVKIRDAGVCPTCDRPFSSSEISNKIGAKEEELKVVDGELDGYAKSLQLTQSLLKDRRSYDQAQERLTGLLEKKEGHEGDVQSNEGKLKELLTKQERVSSRLGRREELEDSLSKADADLAATKKLQKQVQNEKANLHTALSWLAEHKISSQDDLEKLGEEKNTLQKVIGGIPTDISKAPVGSLAIDSFSQGIVSDILTLQTETVSYDESRHAELQSDFTEIGRRLQDKAREQGSLAKELETAKAELLTLTQAEAKLSRASRYVKLFETIRADLFNRDGALATSLRSWALKQISSKASEYIRNFGVGLSMITLQEGRREVDIECYGASGTVDVASMSGGEKVAVALALRFAMASLMSKGRVDFIILDEPTAHLDVDRRKSLVKLISDFNSSPESVSLSQIIVITHDSEIFEDSEVNALFRFESSPEGTIVVKS